MLAVAQSQMQLSQEDFEFFQSEIRRVAGISLSQAKKDLVQSRLRTYVLSLKMGEFAEYREYLQTLPDNHPEWQSFINLLTTNKTDWFREDDHFEYLTKVFLPKWKASGKNHLKVWCAASSTGEEPYTLAMVLDKQFQNTDFTFEIIASDIDTNVLSHAQNGVYPRERLTQIPAEYHKEYFDFGRDSLADWVRVKKSLKAKITFQQLNLSQGPYPWQNEFDLVFCRNVLIYFASATVKFVADHVFATAAKDSLLFIAHSESLQNVKTQWRYIKPSIYVKGGRFV